MKLTEQEQQELRNLSVPLMEWLKSTFHPHVTVILDSERVELLEGVTMERRRNLPDYQE